MYAAERRKVDKHPWKLLQAWLPKTSIHAVLSPTLNPLLNPKLSIKLTFNYCLFKTTPFAWLIWSC